jgi:hypothetical protein
LSALSACAPSDSGASPCARTTRWPDDRRAQSFVRRRRAAAALGLQAYSLGIAYEFDPYFGLSISRVDPLPHQLEAVYDYLLKAPRVRFLLADDAGAAKTIMAGLLIPERNADSVDRS